MDNKPGKSEMDERQMRVYIGQRLREAREGAGWTQDQVGRAVGSDNSSVARWEGALRVPTPDMLVRLSRLFGRPVGWFLGEVEDGEVIDLTGGIDPALLVTIRGWSPDRQGALQEFLPALLTFAGRWTKAG